MYRMSLMMIIINNFIIIKDFYGLFFHWLVLVLKISVIIQNKS